MTTKEQPVSFRSFAWRSSLAALLLITTGPGAGAAGLLRTGGSTPSSTSSTTNNSAVTAAQAAALAQRSQATLLRSNTVQKSIQAMQAAARAAAQAASSNVPNGLGVGGLQVATGVPADLNNVQSTENAALWQGAQLPTQTTGTDGKTDVNIKQTEQQALLTWQTFNVGQKTTLTYDQSAGGSNQSQWVVFNKINDPSGNPSQILGTIKATGQVYVINQNGIIFGGSSQVNTHTLVASALPINDNLVSRGLLNNPDYQFLFSGLALPSGSNGPTPAFNPPAPSTADGHYGDVVVEAGAQLTSPTNADHVGGRIALVGANVANNGTISTPDGQAILAAGLQVGLTAHDSSDPSLRGLDVYVGDVGTYAGTVTNAGIVDAPRADVTMVGKNVNQLGAITSSTSTALNGRIDLLAEYDAESSAGRASGSPFLPKSTGVVTMGADSVSLILPELDNTDRVVGTELSLLSQMNVRGLGIYMGEGATVFAPNAQVQFDAGQWKVLESNSLRLTGAFVHTAGQIYLDKDALIDVAGASGVSANVAENIVSVQLRGTELADYPLQRDGALRGQTVNIDIRQTGVYGGTAWVGTSLADTSGYVNLVQRTVGELTTSGGSVKLNAGGSVVMQSGSAIDVSGGWIDYQAGQVSTSRVMSGGHVYTMAQSTPDLVYSGLAPAVTSYEPGYVQGGSAGSVSITAGSMALDGQLLGSTVAGPRQTSRSDTLATTFAGSAVLPTVQSVLAAPDPGKLSLAFTAEHQDPTTTSVRYISYAPAPPTINIQAGSSLPAADAFALDSSGTPLALATARVAEVDLSTDLFTKHGFGSFTINNADGDVNISASTSLSLMPGASLDISAGNLSIAGAIYAPGGKINFSVYDFSPLSPLYSNTTGNSVTPPVDPSRGVFTLGAESVLSTAGLKVDERGSSTKDVSSQYIGGGSILIDAYDANLADGSHLDVSGGGDLSVSNKIIYGNGGAITVRGGRDPKLTSLTGGQLDLGTGYLAGTGFSGFSGATGGTLSLLAPLIRIDGNAGPADPGVLTLAPDFFSEGGFGGFALQGTGAVGAGAGQYVPGLEITAGTKITPMAKKLQASVTAQGFTLQPVADAASIPQAQRTPVSLAFGASGVREYFDQNILLVRGDLLMGEGAVIRTDPKASVSLTGDTVAVKGAIYAPAGHISITGGSSSFLLFNSANQALPTVELSEGSVLSAAGTTLAQFTPDTNGTRTGSAVPGGPQTRGYLEGDVLDAGTISVTGNIVARTGALIDVSGATDVLDKLLAYDANASSPTRAGVLSRPVATRIDSDGGTITLSGKEELFTNATLLGGAGGSTATGGTLSVSSGRFLPQGSSVVLQPLDVRLTVTQSDPLFVTVPGVSSIGQAIKDEDGNTLAGQGYFTADAFQAGNFDNLKLKGTVNFSGDVTLSAAQSIALADNGVIYGNGQVHLTAPYVQIGTALQPPVLTQTSPFIAAPVYGAGVMTVNSSLIDIGNLSLQGIGLARFNAPGGDIRGDGTLDIAGRIELTAGQVYPPTETTFNIVAHDYTSGGSAHQGSIAVIGSGDRQTPLSAGGRLNLYASIIDQGGVLRAPLGGITLGWNGTGTVPVDFLTGAAVPATQQLTLESGSKTSVSAIDSVTGKGMVIPYGISFDGATWIDPAGNDITVGGVTTKTVNVSAVNVDDQNGSVIDIGGGGDLYAYQWVSGVGGTKDVLAASNSFAIIPSYQSGYAPIGAFGGGSNLDGASGYVNTSLAVGDRVYLAASKGLPAGYYTLLPARYALLPGAYLVTPQGGTPVAKAVAKPDGSYVVSGYRSNGLNQTQVDQPLLGLFEVAASSVVKARAQYEDLLANTFLKQSAFDHDATPPRLPVDSGQLVLTAPAGGGLNLKGNVLSRALDTQGRGGLVDISSPVDIVIAGAGTAPAPGALVLNAADLTNFGADSLLIGGIRDASGTAVTVTTNHMLVDNAGAGSELKGNEIILVANQSLTLAAGATIEQAGSSTSFETLHFGDTSIAGSGDGALLRVTGDASAKIIRTGVSSSTVPTMFVGADAHVSGLNLTLDSTAATGFDASAFITGNAVSLNSGQISLLLDDAGTVGTTSGLVLSGTSLTNLQSNANALSLLSYSSIDIYGHGQIGGVGADNRPSISSLELHAAALRGFNTGGSEVVFAARDILIDNKAGRTAPAAGSSSSGTLSFQAETLRLGANQVAVDQYDSLKLQAINGVSIAGTGGLTQQGEMIVTAPLITAATASDYDVSATGAITLLNSTAATTATLTGGLGAKVDFTGASIDNQAKILLSSGQIALTATTGDILIGGVIDVSGTVQHFYNLDKFTGGGLIQLTSDIGSVGVGPSGSLVLSAQAGAGDAGTLLIDAWQGALSLDGGLVGKAGTGGKGGVFSLDVGSLSSLGALDGRLNDAGFTESRTMRVRTGDVLMDGLATSHGYNLSTDTGAITVTGRIDASGETGGQVMLASNRGVTLSDGSAITVAARQFDSAGKGGVISIETRGVDGSVIDLQSGAKLDLSVTANSADSAAAGDVTGRLHLRAPQNAAQADLLLNPINADIIGASQILVEGYQVFAPAGGLIDTVESAVAKNATIFTANTGDVVTSGTMMNRLFSGNQTLASIASIVPGAEIVNANTTITTLGVNLNTSGSSSLTVAASVPITFPAGTLGDNKVKSTVAGKLTAANGMVTTITANSTFAVPAGSVLTLASSGTLSFSSGTGGAVSVVVPARSSFTSSGSTTLTSSGPGAAVQLSTSGTSSLAFQAGVAFSMPSGTPGNDKITSSVAGIITLADGTTQTLAANTPTAIAPGGKLSFASGGMLTFASGGSGGAIPLTLPDTAAVTVAGAATVSTSTSSLTLNNTWDLSTYRFGPQSVPGVLTLRAAGNINLNFGASLSDGFASTANTSTALWQASLMAAGSRSWSYRLVSGADFQSADYRSVQALSSLPTGIGSLLLGKGATALPTSTSTSVTSQSIIPTYYQVIRTGTGDIDIVSGRDVQLLNSLATIYTAGTQAAPLADFDVPVLTKTGSTVTLGAFQTPGSIAQYSDQGGNVTISAQNDIAHYLIASDGTVTADSSKEMPNNWLYRRGAVDANGVFATSLAGDIASTSWWVDFTTFFEGVGALGGGNVTLVAGRNVTNVDAVAPTNARMSYQKTVPVAGGSPVIDKLAAHQSLVELGGGDVTVRAGNNIDGGVYYVESGHGVIAAGNSIATNVTRAALTQSVIQSAALRTSGPDASTWLPTTLFMGDATFDVSAGADLLLGAVANTFLLPQGQNNRFYERSYFSTYTADAAVSVSSLTGSVNMKDNPADGLGFGSGSLIAWFENVLYASTVSSALPYSASQPWLRLVEKASTPTIALTPFQTVAALMPPTLQVTAFSGDINLIGGLLLSPSKNGSLDLIAHGTVNGFVGNGLRNPQLPYNPTTNVRLAYASTINLSDADPSSIPGVNTPLTSTVTSTPSSLMDGVNALFDETGSTGGVLQTKQTLHAAGLLHYDDINPVHVYAESGNISGLMLFAGKATQVIAGQDITDIALYLQNNHAEDISLVQAGRDIIAYDANSPLRTQSLAEISRSSGLTLPAPLAGDIQIGGPGTLEVLAGRNLDLGAGPNNNDGTGLGITSIGNLRNLGLPFAGASIVAGAGLGSADGLQSAAIDFSVFGHYFLDPGTSSSEVADYLAKFLDSGADVGAFKQQVAAGQSLSSKYLPVLGTLMGGGGATNDQIWALFTQKSQAERNRLALEVFYTILRNAGRDHNTFGSPGYKNYSAGFGAVKALFPGDSWSGDILTDSRLIKTTRGGNVSLLAPGGALKLGSNNAGNSAVNNGILTEYGGNISIFVHGDVNVGTSRIFTLRGGNEIVWASTGDIAAGVASKTVQSAPPTRVLIDPQSGDVQNDLAGLSTGGGIGVLDTVAGVAPGDIDLIAPVGTIDAGDAGIRSSGNLNIAALQVLNASNIQTGGTSTGTPAASAAPVSAPPSTAASEAANSASDLAQSSRDQGRGAGGDNVMPSLISVEVLGYGGSDPSAPDSDQKKDDKDKKDEAKADEGVSPPGQLTQQDSSLDGQRTALKPSGLGQG